MPRLDLSKLHRESELGEEDSSNSMREVLEEENGKNVTYQQYLKFLENESRFDDPQHLANLPGALDSDQHLPSNSDHLGEESQQSIMR